MNGHQKAHEIDVMIGRRIREAREARRVTQKKLGEAICVTFSQIQKIENGTNRVSVGRLAVIAKHLGMPVTDFYEGIW